MTLRIGMKTSAITLGEWDVRAVMLFYAVHLLGWYAFVEHTCLWARLGGVACGVGCGASRVALLADSRRAHARVASKRFASTIGWAPPCLRVLPWGLRLR